MKVCFHVVRGQVEYDAGRDARRVHCITVYAGGVLVGVKEVVPHWYLEGNRGAPPECRGGFDTSTVLAQGFACKGEFVNWKWRRSGVDQTILTKAIHVLGLRPLFS